VAFEYGQNVDRRSAQPVDDPIVADDRLADVVAVELRNDATERGLRAAARARVRSRSSQRRAVCGSSRAM
jgi:hypothetical protein